MCLCWCSFLAVEIQGLSATSSTEKSGHGDDYSNLLVLNSGHVDQGTYHSNCGGVNTWKAGSRGESGPSEAEFWR